MSELISVNLSIDGQTIIMYNGQTPDYYRYDQIFDPDNPVSGTYFPALQSLVIKEDGSLWYVSSRDSLTYRTTLTSCSFVVTEDSSDVGVISYGNDKFCLYIDKRTTPYKLAIDAKLLFYGNNLTEYVITREVDGGTTEAVSVYLDNTDSPTGTRIPMASISDTHVYYKFPTNCHTFADLNEGETVTLQVYNNLGNLAAEITLYVRQAYWWNDASDGTNPVVSLNARCLQESGDDFYVYEKQDPDHLNIVPYLTYADGTTLDLTLDGTNCFLYGLEGFVPSYPGYSQTLIFKYFLNYNELTSLPEGSESIRFLTCTKELVVRSDDNQYSVKVSVIPKYSTNTGEWYLRFFAYSNARDAVHDITDLVTISEDYPFDGTYLKWGVEQHIEFSYNMQSIFNTETDIDSVQAIWLTTWERSTHVRYTFRDSNTSTVVYGVDSSITRRPIIHLDSVLGKYFIPTSIFGNWEAVVESFYTLASPPYDSTYESTPPTPTHFVVRDSSSGAMIMASPISAESFGTLWATTSSISLEGQVVIVEFLYENEGVYEILYGVPVDVVVSSTGYVG